MVLGLGSEEEWAWVCTQVGVEPKARLISAE